MTRTKTSVTVATEKAINPTVNRRQLLFAGLGLAGAAAVGLRPSALLACPDNYIPQGNRCVPEFADPLQGDRQIKLEHKPCLRLSDRVYRLMTRNAAGVKTTEANWDYAFWHGGRNAPYDIGTKIVGQMTCHQSVKHGTRVINWFNCKEIKNGRWTGHWVRYWSATKPITSSGEYELDIYHVEYVSGFNAPPPPHSRWPLPA